MTALHDKRSIWLRLHIDLPLFIALLLMMAGSITIVYSASQQQTSRSIFPTERCRKRFSSTF